LEITIRRGSQARFGGSIDPGPIRSVCPRVEFATETRNTDHPADHGLETPSKDAFPGSFRRKNACTSWKIGFSGCFWSGLYCAPKTIQLKGCAALGCNQRNRPQIRVPEQSDAPNEMERLMEEGMAGKKKDANTAKKPREMLLVQSKVKEYIRSHDMMCSSDLVDALNERVAGILDDAVTRAGSNGRKTARAHDI
jgi:hypothetical protein